MFSLLLKELIFIFYLYKTKILVPTRAQKGAKSQALINIIELGRNVCFFHYSDYRNIQIISRDLDQAALIRTMSLCYKCKVLLCCALFLSISENFLNSTKKKGFNNHK